MFDLYINNFRSFQRQNFNFSRVNILIGENSSGKSSLLKLLLALKQTLDNPFESNLKLNGDFANLGNFEEVVYYKRKNRTITLGITDHSSYFKYYFEYIKDIFPMTKAQLTTLQKKLKDSSTTITFAFSSNLNDHSSIKTQIKNNILGSIEIVQKKTKEHGNRYKMCDLTFELDEKTGIIEDCHCSKEGFLTLLDPSLREKCNIHFQEKAELYFYYLAYLLIFQNFVQNEIDNIRFVNPIGTTPKRFYFQEDRKASFSNIDIEKFINVMSDQTSAPKRYRERLDLLNKVIKEFGIAEELEVIKNKQLPVLALNVKTKDFWSNITDVGFGVSLQIPILFQALLSEKYTSKNQTLLIEQPEVHLHPSLQAKFIESLLSLGDKNRYFIETHSEHIVRKLQVLVKENTFNLKPEDVTIHYFKREPSKFSITEHKIEKSGKLTPSFPRGFYDTSYNLVKALL